MLECDPTLEARSTGTRYGISGSEKVRFSPRPRVLPDELLQPGQRTLRVAALQIGVYSVHEGFEFGFNRVHYQIGQHCRLALQCRYLGVLPRYFPRGGAGFRSADL